MDSLHRFLDNAEYHVDVFIDENVWKVVLPENNEFYTKEEQTIIYDISSILESGISFYCLSYYLVAHILMLCSNINYNPALIRYFINDEQYTEDDILYLYEDRLEEEDVIKLDIMTELFDTITGNEIQGDLPAYITNKAKKYGIEKDLFMLYNIVKHD